MARKTRFLDRPTHSLLRAAEAHSALAATAGPKPAAGEADAAAGLTEAKPRRRRDQTRNERGRFTK